MFSLEDVEIEIYITKAVYNLNMLVELNIILMSFWWLNLLLFIA